MKQWHEDFSLWGQKKMPRFSKYTKRQTRSRIFQESCFACCFARWEHLKSAHKIPHICSHLESWMTTATQSKSFSSKRTSYLYYITSLFIYLYIITIIKYISFGQIIIRSYYLIIFPGGRGGCHPLPLSYIGGRSHHYNPSPTPQKKSSLCAACGQRIPGRGSPGWESAVSRASKNSIANSYASWTTTKEWARENHWGLSKI